jgi:hypothetical protein
MPSSISSFVVTPHDVSLLPSCPWFPLIPIALVCTWKVSRLVPFFLSTRHSCLRCLGSSQYHPVIHPLFAVLLHVLLSVCCCSLRSAFHLLAASSFHAAPRLHCPSQFPFAVSAAPRLSHFCAIWFRLCPLHSLPFWCPLVAPRRLPRSTSLLLHSIRVNDHIWFW